VGVNPKPGVNLGVSPAKLDLALATRRYSDDGGMGVRGESHSPELLADDVSFEAIGGGGVNSLFMVEPATANATPFEGAMVLLFSLRLVEERSGLILPSRKVDVGGGRRAGVVE